MMATTPCCALSCTENLAKKTRFWRIVARMGTDNPVRGKGFPSLSPSVLLSPKIFAR